jgi:hypothetical protein
MIVGNRPSALRASALLAALAGARLGDQEIVLRPCEDYGTAPVAAHQKEVKMGEAARRKAMVQVAAEMKLDATRETAKQLWDASNRTLVDTALMEILKFQMPRAEMAVVGAGLIALAWGDVIDQEAEIFLSAIAQLIVGMRAGQKAARAAAAEAARIFEEEQRRAAEAHLDATLAAEMHSEPDAGDAG